MKRLLKNVTANVDTQFAQQLLEASNEIDASLIKLKTAYQAYENFKNTSNFEDEQYQDFAEIVEGIEYQFRQLTVNFDAVELKTCTQELVDFLNNTQK